MKFKDYIAAISEKTHCITENCENGFAYNYNGFGFETDEATGKKVFALYRDEIHEHLGTTFFDPEQEIKLNGSGINVVDSENNKVTLLFFTLVQINHPTL